ncbi:phosphotransferase family protein [Halorubrum pallidum]
MNETVSTVLRDDFPDRSVAELFDVGPSWNGANETVGVEFADGDRAFCKIAIDGDGTRIARERAVLRYVAAERPVRAPAVLAGDRNGSPPYLVTAPVAGRELLDVWNATEGSRERSTATDTDPGNRRASGDTAPVDTRITCDDGGPARGALLRRVGRTLAALHAERFDSHGEIADLSESDRAGDGGSTPSPDAAVPDAAVPELAVDSAPWPDVLRSTIERTREIGTSERLADHYAAVVDCVESNRDRLTGARAALLHGDVAMPNLFVDDDGIAAIDWELAHVGDPARDLVRAEDQLLNGFDSTGPKRYAAALYDGYRERAGGLPSGFAERRPVYEVVRMLGRSGFLDQWATYLDEPIDALADRAEAELQSRLDAV